MVAKFLVPAPSGVVLQRTRLTDLLSAAVAGPLTLVSAPAGSGKTVLAGSWVNTAAAPGPVVWISLDEEDRLPGVFWTYVLAGLERGGVDVDDIPRPDAAEQVEHSLLVRVAARIFERSTPIVLILDDAQNLTRPLIGGDLDFLLRHAGGLLRLVVLTRADPGLPLLQYRLEGTVTEIRFADLAFTAAEARELLTACHPRLSDSAVEAVSYRTRGWAAGLRLAEVSDAASGPDDLDPSVLAASDIAAYFQSEVLGSHGDDVRDVLLATSVADRLAPDLARHLSGSRDAGATLRALAQENAFVEAVPGPDEAYRFTPLVRDLLTAEMRTEHPVRWRHLHRKAARWLAGRDQTVEALQQYAAAGDWGDVAGAFVQGLGVGRLLAGTSRSPLATTLATMPADVHGAGASVAAAAVAVLQGELEACDKHLAAAQELVPAGIAGRTVELDMAIALTALARSAAAGGAGGGPAVDAAERAYARAAAVRTVDAATAALVAFGRGCAQLADGDLASARQTLSWAGAAARDARAPDLAARCLARLALGDALLGRLADAVDAAGAAAACARHQDDAARGLPVAAEVALAWVDSERGNVADAATRIRTADTGAALRNDAVCAAAVALVHARVLRSRGDLPAALEALARLRDLDVALPEWLEHRVAGSAAGLLVAQGQPGAAAERVQPSAGEGAWPSLLALGWAELPLGAPDESRQLARRVTEQPDAPLDLRVDAHLLVAATALALGHAAAAAAALDEAVRLASPEGIRRPFDEAPRRLRALVRPAGHQTPQARPGPSGSAAVVPRARQPDGLVIQPLTERESEVLVHLDAHLRTEEIAAEMFVSVNTVKTHIRAILRKLSTERRTDAIRRARDLGLI